MMTFTRGRKLVLLLWWIGIGQEGNPIISVDGEILTNIEPHFSARGISINYPISQFSCDDAAAAAVS